MRNKLLNLFKANAKRGSIKAEGNVIFLYDFIVSSEDEAYWYGGVSAEGFAKILAGMTGPVTVKINSPGGDVFGGRAMAAAIRGYDGEVTVQIDGYAASAASTVAIAGDKVMAGPDAMMMIHRAWTITLGNMNDHLDTASLLEKIDSTIADAYTAKAGGDADAWLDAMTQETWYTAAEALDAGLIDEIMSPAPKSTSNAVQWDLSAYANFKAPDNSDKSESDHKSEDDDALLNEQANARARSLAVALL
jgi:ATP-dependent Clp protease, protease subunit